MHDSVAANLPRFPDILDSAPGVAWVGPVADFDWCSLHVTDAAIVRGFDDGDVTLTGWAIEGAINNIYTISLRAADLSLDLARPESRMHLAAVMGRGLKCPVCHGRRHIVRLDLDPPDECEACMNTPGFERPPHDVRHLLDGPLGTLRGDLAHHSGRLLAESAVRVSKGLGPVLGILLPWENCGTGRQGRYSLTNVGGNLVCEVGDEHARIWKPGWRLLFRSADLPSGPETGDLGKAAADRAALAAGFALLGDDGSLTTPPGE